MSSGQGQMLLMCSKSPDALWNTFCNIFFLFFTPGIVYETLQQYCVQIILGTTISGLDTRFNLAIASKLHHVQALSHLYTCTYKCNFHQQIMNLRTTSQNLSQIITLWYTTKRSTVAAYTKEFTVKHYTLMSINFFDQVIFKEQTCCSLGQQAAHFLGVSSDLPSSCSDLRHSEVSQTSTSPSNEFL